MGRKIDMKKIEDVTKCQVTFSKRRSSLMKKANEIAVCCDVDVAFVAFSPSGRVSKFCSQKRIEDVLHRYVNLPADKRLNHINNVQEKMEKLKQLRHINSDTSKLHYLDKQIENLELQIKKTGLELQILETDLRDYEIGPEQEPSLHQLSWCERNLNHSLQRVIARKMELESQSRKPFPTSVNQNDQVSMIENPLSGQILMQLDPWISPYSAKVRESIFQDLVDQGKQPISSTNTLDQPIPSNISKPPIQESAPLHITSEQSFMMDQPLFNFHDHDNFSAYTASLVVFSDAIHMSTQSSCSIQDPRPTTNTTAINPSTMGSGLQCIKSNSMSQFRHMEGAKEIGSVDNTFFLNGNNARNENNINGGEDFRNIHVDQIHKHYQQQGAYNLHRHKEACQEPQFDNHLLEEIGEDNSHWSLNLQKSSSLWEWDDLLLDENFNLQNFPPL